MAWNQSGGNGSRDPWGDRGGQQGPPDLDEALRKMQDQLGRIFGKKSGSGDSGGSDSGSGGGGISGGAGIGLGVIGVILFLVWGFAGIFIVDQSEEAVILRFGKLHTSVGPGPHWAPYFIDEVIRVNVQTVREETIGFRSQGAGTSQAGTKSTVPSEALMLTKDENIVDVQFSVQYRISDPSKYLFNVFDPILTLREVIESSVREIVGHSDMDFVITTGRDLVAIDVQTLSQEILNDYGTGLLITSVNMQDAQPPAQVQESFLDAIKAREDQQRFINEARAYANNIVPKARGEAEAILEQANGYSQRVVAQAQGETSRFLQVLAEYKKAPDITRERLYIEAMESVLSNSSKVLVDVDNSNNLMYLPLDQLMRSGQGASSTSPGGNFNSSPNKNSGVSIIDRRSRESRTARTR